MAAAQARADAMIAKAEADGRAAQLEAAQFMAGQANTSVGSPGAAPPVAAGRPLAAAAAGTRPVQAGVRGLPRLVRRDVRRPAGDHRSRPWRGPQPPAAGARGSTGARPGRGGGAGGARRRSRAVPGRRTGRDRVHPLRHHRPDAARGRGRPPAGDRPVRRPRARVRRLPRARPLRPQQERREPRLRRVGDRPRARSAGARGRRRAADRVRARGPLGRSPLRRAERARRGRRRDVLRAGRAAAGGLPRAHAPAPHPRQRSRERQELVRATSTARSSSAARQMRSPAHSRS